MEDLKVLWSDLKRSPAILITVIAVIIIILYVLYKQNSNNASTSTTSTSTGVQPYYVDQISVTPPPPSTTTTTTSGTTTTTSSGTPKTVTTSGYFATTPGGTNNGGTNIASLVPGNVVGLINSTPSVFNNNKYYQVTYNGTTGYVRSTTIGL